MKWKIWKFDLKELFASGNKEAKRRTNHLDIEPGSERERSQSTVQQMRDCGGAFEIRPSDRKLRLRAANGAEMQHDGEKDVTFRHDDSSGILGLTFQVTEVKKALAAVWRLAEHGNIIQFGPEAEQNFIMNLSTQQKIPLHKRGGSYVMQVEFMKWITEEPTPREANQVFQGQAK